MVSEKTREEVVRVIPEDEPFKPKELAKGIKPHFTSVYKVINELVDEGKVKKIQGRPAKYKKVKDDTLRQENNVGLTQEQIKQLQNNNGDNQMNKEELRRRREERTKKYLRDLIPEEENKEYINRKIGGRNDLDILKGAFEDDLNVAIIGETGTGKTHLARILAKEKEVPYFRVSLNGGATLEDLVGQYVPSEGNGKNFEWQDGILTKMAKYGGVLVGDEINVAPQEILFVLNSILDHERKLTLPQHNDEVIKAHDDFMFIATMNPSRAYKHTKELNQALWDRFDLIMRFDFDKDIDKQVLKDINYDEEKAIELLGFVDELRNMREEVETPISTRTLLQFIGNRKRFNYDVAKRMFLNKLGDTEREAVEELFELHFEKAEEDMEYKAFRFKCEEESRDVNVEIREDELKFKGVKCPKCGKSKNVNDLEEIEPYHDFDEDEKVAVTYYNPDTYNNCLIIGEMGKIKEHWDNNIKAYDNQILDISDAYTEITDVSKNELKDYKEAKERGEDYVSIKGQRKAKILSDGDYINEDKDEDEETTGEGDGDMNYQHITGEHHGYINNNIMRLTKR